MSYFFQISSDVRKSLFQSTACRLIIRKFCLEGHRLQTRSLISVETIHG